MASTPRLADGREYPQFLAQHLDDALAGRLAPGSVAQLVTKVKGALRALDPNDTDAFRGAYAEPLLDETHRRLERARLTAVLPRLEQMVEADHGQASR